MNKWRKKARPQDIRVGKYFMLSDFLYSYSAIARGIPNVPESFESPEVKGMRGLCKFILDPVVEQFGSISITFAFCSRALWGRWYPNGKPDPYALHLFRPPQGGVGGAADILVHSADNPRMVINWIRTNCIFDRLILYPGSPIICVAWTEVKPRYHAKEWVYTEGQKAQYLTAGWHSVPKKLVEAPAYEQQTLFDFKPKDCYDVLLSPNASLISFLSQ